MNRERVEEFKRNNSLEDLLKEINTDLGVVEEKLACSRLQRYPVVFVMGPLRSGTTMMMQWLAATGEIAYPTNMLSRFFGAPIMGAKIQRLLADEKYNFRNEILDFNSKPNYVSENGKTKGALSPNEFWYFWRRFIQYDSEIEFVDNEVLLGQENMGYFRDEIIGMTEVFEKPFALKGMICNYNIEFLDKLFDKALFIYTKRDPYTNIESALNAREKQSGDIHEWYSFKIPEYPELMKYEDPVKQVTGQIYYNNAAIMKGLSRVDESRKMIVEYEDFCKEPERYYKQLVEKLEGLGCRISPIYIGEKSFSATKREPSPEIEKYYKEFMDKNR